MKKESKKDLSKAWLFLIIGIMLLLTKGVVAATLPLIISGEWFYIYTIDKDIEKFMEEIIKNQNKRNRGGEKND